LGKPSSPELLEATPGAAEAGVAEAGTGAVAT